MAHGENMDVIIEKKKGIQKKHIKYIAAAVIFIGFVVWVIIGSRSSKLNVEKDRVTIQTVIKGEFNDYVNTSGQVLPINTIQLSAIEGGRVEEKFIEEGSMVKEGEIILRLTNPDLNLEILNAEARLAEQMNRHRDTELAMEQDKLNLRKDRLSLDLDVAQKQRTFEQYKILYEEELVSREEYLKAKENYELARDSRALVIERQKQDSLIRGNQIQKLREELQGMYENVNLVRQKKENLNLRAPFDGQLGVLNAEIGQNIARGSQIGTISILSDFKVEAFIDQHYNDRLIAGLDATLERQDKNYTLRIRKIYPEVRENGIKADFVFVGERPENIRVGQTYYIKLQLAEPVEAVIIPRGPFYQTTGGKWIYVVTPDGKKAVKREIIISRQNPTFYEVVSGLEPGENVITSSYENFGDVQELILK